MDFQLVTASRNANLIILLNVQRVIYKLNLKKKNNDKCGFSIIFVYILSKLVRFHSWACSLVKSLPTWLAAMGELFFTHSSTILTTARRILGSGDFSIRDVRMTWMKFFLISMLMTESRVFTRSRLSITSSLVTV